MAYGILIILLLGSLFISILPSVDMDPLTRQSKYGSIQDMVESECRQAYVGLPFILHCQVSSASGTSTPDSIERGLSQHQGSTHCTNSGSVDYSRFPRGQLEDLHCRSASQMLRRLSWSVLPLLALIHCRSLFDMGIRTSLSLFSFAVTHLVT